LDRIVYLTSELAKYFLKEWTEMNVTKEEYKQMADKASPGSTYGKNLFFAFVIGGAICTLGQFLVNLFLQYGNELKDARAWTSIALIGLSAILTALNVYDNIAKYAGAGTIVPITGFANSIVSPAMEFKSEGYIIGMGGKMFVIAGPVLVYSATASIIYGLIIWFFKLY
jgi:stage V sporulation protein AC